MIGVIINFKDCIRKIYLQSPCVKTELISDDIFRDLVNTITKFLISVNQVTTVSVDGELKRDIQPIWRREVSENCEWCDVT